jgi:hypothetical protein
MDHVFRGSMAKKQVDPLPTHTVEEVTASQKAPLPDGVTMVRMKKCVTGMHVHVRAPVRSGARTAASVIMASRFRY